MQTQFDAFTTSAKALSEQEYWDKHYYQKHSAYAEDHSIQHEKFKEVYEKYKKRKNQQWQRKKKKQAAQNNSESDAGLRNKLQQAEAKALWETLHGKSLPQSSKPEQPSGRKKQGAPADTKKVLMWPEIYWPTIMLNGKEQCVKAVYLPNAWPSALFEDSSVQTMITTKSGMQGPQLNMDRLCSMLNIMHGTSDGLQTHCELMHDLLQSNALNTGPLLQAVEADATANGNGPGSMPTPNGAAGSEVPVDSIAIQPDGETQMLGQVNAPDFVPRLFAEEYAKQAKKHFGNDTKWAKIMQNAVTQKMWYEKTWWLVGPRTGRSRWINARKAAKDGRLTAGKSLPPAAFELVRGKAHDSQSDTSSVTAGVNGTQAPSLDGTQAQMNPYYVGVR